MKRIFALSLVLISATAFGQSVGTVTYERKIDMHRRITDEQMRAMIPQFRTSKHMLLFSDSVSVYKLLPENEAPDPFEGGGGGGVRFSFRAGGPGDAGFTYKNFATGMSLSETELGDKTYVITDTIRQPGWKLSDETKTILGITCKKATRKITAAVGGATIRMGGPGGAPRQDTANATPRMQEITIVAWYAESLPTPVGPEDHGNLPGLVLEVDRNNGETVWTALDIKKTVDSKELKEPKKGKRITRTEFAQKQQEMFRNMQMSGGNQIRIGG